MQLGILVYLLTGLVVGIVCAIWMTRRFRDEYRLARRYTLSDVLASAAVVVTTVVAAPVLWPFYLTTAFFVWAEGVEVK